MVPVTWSVRTHPVDPRAPHVDYGLSSLRARLNDPLPIRKHPERFMGGSGQSMVMFGQSVTNLANGVNQCSLRLPFQ